MHDMPHAIRAIDLFAGVGGSSTGARTAGVQVVAAIDSWSLARDTYTSNFPDVTFIQRRCEEVSVRELKNTIGTVDLLLASPECTSHTCAKGSAPRSEASRRTAFQVIRFARAFKPRWVVIENVVHMRTWKSYEHWLGALKELGYKVREQIINASDHGVSRSPLYRLGDGLVERQARHPLTAQHTLTQVGLLPPGLGRRAPGIDARRSSEPLHDGTFRGTQSNVLLEGLTMPKVPDIMPVTDLRQDAAAALKRVRASKEPLVITQRGRAAAVILSVEVYERGEHERHLLRLLARGEKEIAAGQGYDLDEVLEEADALLARASK